VPEAGAPALRDQSALMIRDDGADSRRRLHGFEMAVFVASLLCGSNQRQNGFDRALDADAVQAAEINRAFAQKAG